MTTRDKNPQFPPEPKLRVVGENEPRRIPYDIDLEQALLGAILVDNSALDRASEIMMAEHFYDPLHARMWDAMLSMRETLTITPLTINAALKADDGLSQVGGLQYLANVAAAAPALPNVRDYARILRDLAVRRSLIGIGDSIASSACEASIDASPLTQLEAGESALQALRDSEAHRTGSHLPVLDMARWECQAPPERKWLVRDRIPARNVTLLSGEGAVGKTLLAEQLAVATVLGKEWLGVTPKQGPVLLVCCEDDDDEMHIRFRSIVDFYGARFTDLLNGLFPVSLVGMDTIVAQPDRERHIQPTPLYQHLFRLARKIKPALIVLDNSADLFAGDENDRAQVRQFIALLRRVAVDVDTAVLLTSHPSVRGTETGSGFSGSTAWHASVRARLYMKRPKDGDIPADPDERVLEVMKSNYGPAGETIALRWHNGLFIPADGNASTWVDKRAAERATDELFLRLLGVYEAQGRNVSHKSSAPGSYAPKLFAKEPDARGTRKEAFEAAMNRLFNAGQIHVAKYGKPSRQFEKLATGAAP